MSFLKNFTSLFRQSVHLPMPLVSRVLSKSVPPDEARHRKAHHDGVQNPRKPRRSFQTKQLQVSRRIEGKKSRRKSHRIYCRMVWYCLLTCGNWVRICPIRSSFGPLNGSLFQTIATHENFCHLEKFVSLFGVCVWGSRTIERKIGGKKVVRI